MTRDELLPLLAKVAACEHRGSVLGVSRQPECGCEMELTECRAGRGRRPGEVTVHECIQCQESDQADWPLATFWRQVGHHKPHA